LPTDHTDEHRSAHPPEKTADHADRRRRSRGRLEHVARSRPSNDGRGPLGRATAPKASFRRGVPVQRPALCGAQASPLLILCCWMDGAPLSKQEKGQAKPTRPGRVGRWEVRQRRTLASGVDVLITGWRRSPDRRQFRRQSPAPQPMRLSVSICVICGQSWVGGWICADLRYLRFLLCAFCASVV